MDNSMQQTAEIVNSLFISFDAIFPAAIHTIRENGNLSATKQEWTYAFMENGINTLEQLERGKKVARPLGGVFLPPMGKFMDWCKITYASLGWPEPLDAYRLALKRTYDVKYNSVCNIHQAVEIARKETGDSVFGRGEKVSEPVFLRNYEIIRDRVGNGESLHNIKPAKGITENKPHSRSDTGDSAGFGGYDWETPGIMKQYAGITTHEECMDVCEEITKNNLGMKGLRTILKRLKPSSNES